MNRKALQAIGSVLRTAAVAAFCALALRQPLLAAPAPVKAAAPPASHCTVQPVNYDGWKAEQMSNRWVKLIFVPQLGGRLMQVTFGGHDYIFVNDQLKGQVTTPDTEHHRWYNYGGDKIWPMPEGNQDEQHWAGAGGSVLDEGPSTLTVISRSAECAVRITNPGDPQIGQQYIRDIRIGSDSPVISFHAVMKNVSGYTQTWSEQSVSQYNAAAPGDSSQLNPKFWGVTPVNPSSVYPNGYHVRNGNPDNPGYTVTDGLFHAAGGAGGEVWTDSTAGWLAVVDGSTGYTMVERRKYDPKATYPDQTTMIFFTTGSRNRRPPASGGIGPAPGADASGAPSTGRRGAAQGPEASGPGRGAAAPIHYMEAEVDSPMVELAPGESYAMDSTWYPTRMGEDFKTALSGGVIGTPLAAAAAPSGLTLTGSFGVFYAGSLVAHYYDRGGQAIGTAKLIDVSPLDKIDLNSTVQAPPGTFRVSVHVVEKSGLDRGLLGEAFVNPPPPAPPRRNYNN